MKEQIPQNQFFDDFYMWFNPKERKEYYATPIYFYSSNQNIDFDNRSVTISLEKDIRKVRPKKEIVLKNPALTYFPYKEKLGMFLLNFLNADFNTFEQAYNTFFYNYGFEILKPLYEDIELKGKYSTEKEFLEEMKIAFENSKDKILEYQQEYIKCVTYVFNIDNKEKLQGFRYNTRFLVYLLKHIGKVHLYCKDITIIRDETLAEYIKLEEKTEEQLLIQAEEDPTLDSIIKVYKSNDISNICYYILEEIAKNENNPIKRCKHCDKYFIPSSRLDEVYCEYIREDGTTCKEIGAKLVYKQNIKDNKAIQEYNKVYQQKLMAVTRNKANKELKQEFEEWKKIARAQMKLFKENKLTEEETYNWIINNK